MTVKPTLSRLKFRHICPTLGSRSHCESISVALVQINMTAMTGQATTGKPSKKDNGLQMVATHHCSFHFPLQLSFLLAAFSLLVARVHLQPIQVAQIISFSSTLRGVVRCAVSPCTVSRVQRRWQETGSYSRLTGQGRRSSRSSVCCFSLAKPQISANVTALHCCPNTLTFHFQINKMVTAKMCEWHHVCYIYRLYKAFRRN